jgi:copper(I)-binding protein
MKTFIASLVLATACTSASSGPADIKVDAAWIHAAAAGAAETWAFATITNPGPANAITGVRSADADSVILRGATVTDAGRTTRTVLSIPVPAHGSVVLRADTWFVAFLGAKQPFVPGTTVTGTVHFASGADVPVTFRVSDAEGDPADGGP